MRRILAGAALTVALAIPISGLSDAVVFAHHPLVTGEAICVDGTPQIRWTVTADAVRGYTWSVNGAPAKPDSQPFMFTNGQTTFAANGDWWNQEGRHVAGPETRTGGPVALRTDCTPATTSSTSTPATTSSTSTTSTTSTSTTSTTSTTSSTSTTTSTVRPPDTTTSTSSAPTTSTTAATSTVPATSTTLAPSTTRAPTTTAAPAPTTTDIDAPPTVTPATSTPQVAGPAPTTTIPPRNDVTVDELPATGGTSWLAFIATLTLGVGGVCLAIRRWGLRGLS